MKYAKYFLLTLFIIALDQVVKLWVHFNMEMGVAGQIEVFGDWFKLYYTLNPGMAFGMQFGSEYGKLGLSLFRLVAMFFIGYYLYKLAKEKTHPGVLWSIAAVLAGAIGNLIDSIFYGVWLDNAPYNAISPWFHGQVVDMFYVDIWEGRVADWVPLWGGDYISLWPIFNVADASIFCGVAVILIFQKKFFKAVKQETVS
ncbi:lipoprotein signal peptidase [Marivirga arenosa]|uniref:Lipoprotein signal peptidase n=1 Tax=Marivirga arenosa TaxID=3059076 RepID=A0AA51RDT0_9BACT|nr:MULTISPECIES: lipoprotein signal peptidase [unclassified Marivirga]WKK83154.2 lipoprotein signal peptidase [Marivirga sp. BKB1-2]WMN07730.1 lipoprotein signal peptidase [Marivirga sp. ABR2-2]